MNVLFKLYKRGVSPILVALFGHSCRYRPTCSEYAREAIKEWGIVRGLFLSLKRVGKCNPLFSPGFDPVPQKLV